jgi:hypothetical protein
MPWEYGDTPPSYVYIAASQYRNDGRSGETTLDIDALTGVRISHYGDYPREYVDDPDLSGSSHIWLDSTGIRLDAHSSSNGAVDIDGDLRLTRKNERIWGKRPDGSFVETFQPQNENGNTVVGWGNYNNSSGNTNVYGNDVCIGAASIGKKTFRPYVANGDSYSFQYRGSGFVTGNTQQIFFTISLSKPLIGSPTVSLVTSTLVLRQNGQYTHGSAYNSSTSSYTSARPSSYTVARSADGSALNVMLKITTTTNATNNAPIGVDWLGAITFTY